MTQISTSKAFVTAREAWLFDLRSACLVLSDQPAHVISAISVTQRFIDLEPSEREQLVLLANNMAGEYRLSAEVSDNGTWFTARLCRTSDDQPHSEAPRDDTESTAVRRRPGLLAGLLMRLRPAGRVVARAVETATTTESLVI